jgi:hypothetical protein
MTGTEDSGAEGASVRKLNGTRIVRACCALVALLLAAAVVYGGVMVLENYAQIAV